MGIETRGIQRNHAIEGLEKGRKSNYNILFLPGACEGTLACSTCHVIFEEETYKQLGPISDEEMDMLDLAYGLTDT